jgi:hypothetical protein
MIFAAIEALLLFKRGDAMGKHARYVVNLEKHEVEYLEELISQGKRSARLITRARILLRKKRGQTLRFPHEFRPHDKPPMLADVAKARPRLAEGGSAIRPRRR